MVGNHRRDSGGVRQNAFENSEHLRHRFDSRRELRAQCDAVSAGDRDGGDVEPGADEPRGGNHGGEDPYLAKVMGVAFVRGLEGNDVSADTRVASSLKHYMGYSFPLNGRDRTSAWIPENYLREYFLPTFDAAVKSGARTVMVNSAEINGVPGHVNKHVLTDILRNELGFKGFVVSD